MSQTRRLAAILAADVAGYSRLIEADEEGTLGRLKALRAEVIDPRIASHKGRLVKTTGDGLLVEFASVVDALRCAAEIQAAMAESNAGVPTDRRIEFRIGINVGDIDAIAKDVAILGDDITLMDADPEVDPPVWRQRGIAFRNGRLQLGRATHRVDDARKLDQQPIAGGLDNPAPMAGDLRVDDFGAQRLESAKRALLVGLDQPRIARDIGRENRRQPTAHGHRCLIHPRAPS